MTKFNVHDIIAHKNSRIYYKVMQVRVKEDGSLHSYIVLAVEWMPEQSAFKFDDVVTTFISPEREENYTILVPTKENVE